MSFGQSDTLRTVELLITPNFLDNKLRAADPLAFIQFSAECDAQLLAIDGNSKYLPADWTVDETTPDPTDDPVQYAVRQTRDEKHNYVQDPPSKVIMETLQERIRIRMIYDNTTPAPAIRPPNYTDTEVTYLGILQNSVKREEKMAEK